MNIITSVYSDERSKGFHLTPFQQFWIPDENSPEQHERLYSEIYTLDVAIEYQRSIDILPRLEGDDLERVVIPLMFASDTSPALAPHLSGRSMLDSVARPNTTVPNHLRMQHTTLRMCPQ